MRILVTGGSGLLGSRIVKYGTLSHEMFSTYFEHKFSFGNAKIFKLNIRDKKEVGKLINKIKPDVVIHVAALVNADFCETNYTKAYNINVNGVKNLAEKSLDVGSKFVFISSSYVFDGLSGPYTEKDETKPINKYGEMKLLCEKLISSMFEDWLIVRTSVIYGWNVTGQRLNFVAWVIDQLSKNKEIKIVTDQIGTPTFANNGAQAIIQLIEKKKNGVYHVVGDECISRFDFALKIAKNFNFDKKLLIPIKSNFSNQVAKRPMNDCLSIEKVKKELKFHFFNVEDGLLAMKKRSREEEQEWLLQDKL